MTADALGPGGGDLIREARLRAGLTQAQLAERAGTTQSSVARWESRRTEPAFRTVVRLLRLCGFVLDVHLEPWDDHDLSLAARLVPMSPEQRIDYHQSVVEWFQELRRAGQASGLA